MAELINVGSAPNDGTGDSLLTAANKVNLMYAELVSTAPVEIAGLNNLTFSGAVVENTAPGVLIGELVGKTSGSVVDIIDDAGMQVVMASDYRIYTGFRATSYAEAAQQFPVSPKIQVVVQETITDGTTTITRRSTIDIPVTQDATITPGTAPDIHVRAVATGAADGSSWANAYGIASLQSLIATAPANTVIGVLADDGIVDNSTTITIGPTNSGVVVTGMRTDYRPRHCALRGTRARWYRRTDDEAAVSAAAVIVDGVAYDMRDGQSDAGNRMFLLSGTVGGTVKWFTVMHVASVMHWTAATANWEIERISTFNVGRGFSEIASQTAAPNLTNSNFRWCQGIGASKPWMRFRGNSNNIRCYDCDIDCRRIDKDSFAVGYSLDDRSTSTDPVLKLEAAHNIQYFRCVARNAHMSAAQNTYWNADGFSSERQNFDILYEDCEAYGCTDGGWDVKSQTTVFTRCISARNKRNYRLWGGEDTPMVFTDCVADSPLKRGGTGAALQVGIFSTTGDAGADITWIGGAFLGGSVDNPQVQSEGTNNCIRLIDLDTTAAVYATFSSIDDPSSYVMLGTEIDTTPPTITTPTALDIVVDKVMTIPLTADSEVFWRIRGGTDAAEASILGQMLIVEAQPTLTDTLEVIIEARDASNNFTQATLTLTVANNPVRSSALLVVPFNGTNGATTAQDSTTLNIVEIVGTTISTAKGYPALRVLASGVGYARVADRAEWRFGGPFTVKAKVSVDSINLSSTIPLSLVSQWLATGSGANRAWNLALYQGRPAFYWSVDGATELSLIDDVALTSDTEYEVCVDVDSSGFARLYVDGSMVAKSASGAVTFPLAQSTADLRIGVTASNNSPGSFTGYLRDVEVDDVARYASDAGYTP